MTIATREQMFLRPTMQEAELTVVIERQPTTREHTLTNTNDQLIHPGTRSFIYADNLCITAQANDLAQNETTLTLAVSGLSVHYIKNQLCTNPAKSQVTPFPLH